MRILRLTQRLPPLPGGLEVHVRELSLAQAARGAHVEILFAEGDPVEGGGVTSHRLAPLGERHPLARRWSSQQRFGAAVSRVTRCTFGPPQLIHAHGDYALAAAALHLGKRFRCPVVLTVHGGLSERPWHRALSRAIFPRLDHAIAVSPDVAAQLQARGLPQSRITILPSGLHRSRFHPLPPEQRTAIRTHYGIGLTHAPITNNLAPSLAPPSAATATHRDPPLCVGQGVGGEVLPHPAPAMPPHSLPLTKGEAGGGLPLASAPASAPSPANSPLSASERGTGSEVLPPILAIAVGRLHPVKGYRHLLAAMHLLAQAPYENPTTPELPHSHTPTLPHSHTPLHLLLVGDGPEAPALRAAAHGLPNVTFTGALPPSEVAQLLGAADLFIHPAVELGTQREGTPTSVLEALAAGLPVIATPTGGLPALLRDGEHGRLVPPEDPAALAATMQELAANPALRAAQSARNRRHPACRDWNEVATRLLELYASLLPAGSRAPAASEAAW